MKFTRVRSAVLMLPLLSVIYCSSASGQEVTKNSSNKAIEQEIKAHEETDLSLLSKSRAVLIKALTEKDTAKAANVLEYMQGKFDTSKVVILYPVEKVLVEFWLGNYQSIFESVLQPQFENPDYSNKLTPQHDLFYYDLKEISRKKSALLNNMIKYSSLPQYKKDFLYLLLNSMIKKNDTIEEQAAYWEEMNRQSGEYLAFNKDSEFNPFIHKYLRYVLKTSPWGFGYEFSVGYLALPVNLSRNFDDFGLLSMAFESSYKDIYGCLRLDLGIAEKIRKEFTANGGTWNEGMKVSHVGALLAFGPMISLGNNFTLTPNAGIGYMDFSPPDQEKNKFGEEVSISFPVWALGLNFDVPFKGESSTLFFRFNIGHRSAMTDMDIAKGGYTFITIGIDLFGRPSYRDF